MERRQLPARGQLHHQGRGRGSRLELAAPNRRVSSEGSYHFQNSRIAMWPYERRGNWRVTGGEDSQEWLSHMISGIEGRELTVKSTNFVTKRYNYAMAGKCRWGTRSYTRPLSTVVLQGRKVPSVCIPFRME